MTSLWDDVLEHIVTEQDAVLAAEAKPEPEPGLEEP